MLRNLKDWELDLVQYRLGYKFKDKAKLTQALIQPKAEKKPASSKAQKHQAKQAQVGDWLLKVLGKERRAQTPVELYDKLFHRGGIWVESNRFLASVYLQLFGDLREGLARTSIWRRATIIEALLAAIWEDSEEDKVSIKLFYNKLICCGPN